MITEYSTDALIEAACASVLEWLRDPRREPALLDSVSEPLRSQALGEIVKHFLDRASGAGFTLKMVNDGTGDAPKLAGHWAYHGSQLEGFKQPPYQLEEDAARIHACAALLRNEWCARRLP